MELTKEMLEIATVKANHAQLLVMYEAIKSERDALAVQVEALRDKLSEVVALLDVDGMTAVQWLLDNCPEIESLTNIEPEQHLAEIRAQAGRAGFVAGYMLCNDGSPLIKHNYKGFADKYAETIRQGEVK